MGWGRFFLPWKEPGRFLSQRPHISEGIPEKHKAICVGVLYLILWGYGSSLTLWQCTPSCCWDSPHLGFLLTLLFLGNLTIKKTKRLAAKIDRLPSYPSQAPHFWGILCACYRHADVDAGRMDTFPQLPFPLFPHQIICGDVSQLEGQSFQTGHPSCLYGTCASELISLPAFVDKKYV